MIKIRNKKELEEKIKKIKLDGVKNLHIVSDFDRTLTKVFVNGKKTISVISILRDEKYISEEYAQKASELANKYHPIEIDPKIPLEEKKKAMYQWWTKHFELLIRSGLNKKDLQRIVDSGKIKFREGALKFLDFSKEKKIPLIILSSNGLGGDIISMLLDKKNRLYKNIHIVSNIYEWNKKENAIAVKKPIIHVMNKNETSLKEYPFYKEIKDRKNVILLGDSLSDIDMINDLKYYNVIKIGFLNLNIEEQLEDYLKVYDVIITKDGSMDYVNDLIKGLK